MARNKNDYFTLLENQIAYSVQAAELLENLICNFNNSNLDVEKERMHKIEHQADEIHHDISNKLSSEFITVIEQEDILNLSQIIDDITDELDEVTIELYMYNLSTTPLKAYELAKVVNRCVKALQAAICDLRNFRKSERLPELLIDVSSIETEADALYIEAIHNLFKSNVDFKTLIGHKSILESLENCCDLCSHSVNVIKQIIIKNT